MAKSAHIDIEDLKTANVAKPRVTVDDFPNRDAAFEYLLEKVDTLTDNITKLQAEAKK